MHTSRSNWLHNFIAASKLRMASGLKTESDSSCRHAEGERERWRGRGTRKWGKGERSCRSGLTAHSPTCKMMRKQYSDASLKRLNESYRSATRRPVANHLDPCPSPSISQYVCECVCVVFFFLRRTNMIMMTHRDA